MTMNNNYRVFFAIRAKKDLKKLRKSGYWEAASKILRILEADPFRKPPAYGVLSGDMVGCYSRRINIQHRIVYRVDENENIVEIVSCWTHYHE
jgi:Txe/YoeB family toxin of toxin-antitoxin system